MKSLKELEQKIEKHIIETLSNYREIKDILENKDYSPEQKIKHSLYIINHLKEMRIKKFKLDSEYAANDLVLEGEYELTMNLEELKLEILHNILNNSSIFDLIDSDD